MSNLPFPLPLSQDKEDPGVVLDTEGDVVDAFVNPIFAEIFIKAVNNHERLVLVVRALLGEEDNPWTRESIEAEARALLAEIES